MVTESPALLPWLQKELVPFLQQVFMPIVSTIFAALTSEVDENDQVTREERNSLRQGYFLFVSTLVNNGVTEVLSNQSQSASSLARASNQSEQIGLMIG